MSKHRYSARDVRPKQQHLRVIVADDHTFFRNCVVQMLEGRGIEVVGHRLIRAQLPTRKTFFDDVRALLRYMCFPSREAMMDFMMRGLEIGPYALADA